MSCVCEPKIGRVSVNHNFNNILWVPINHTLYYGNKNLDNNYRILFTFNVCVILQYGFYSTFLY